MHGCSASAAPHHTLATAGTAEPHVTSQHTSASSQPLYTVCSVPAQLQYRTLYDDAARVCLEHNPQNTGRHRMGFEIPGAGNGFRPGWAVKYCTLVKTRPPNSHRSAALETAISSAAVKAEVLLAWAIAIESQVVLASRG